MPWHSGILLAFSWPLFFHFDIGCRFGALALQLAGGPLYTKGGHPMASMERVHAWEAPVDGGEDAKQIEAGAELADLLCHLYAEGSLSAKHTCLIAHWARQAGAKGAVAEVAFRPNAPSGHYQRHLDVVMGFGTGERFYKIAVPGHTKHSSSRTMHDIAVLPPHELLHKEFVEQPGLSAKAASAVWPAEYTQHPIAQASPNPVTPLAFYMDGCQFTKAGAQVLVFVVVNILSGVQHLAAVLRKKEICKCGCRGWCSIRPLLEFFRWSFGALGMGAFPAACHDGTPFAQDSARAALGGLAMACGVCAVQQVKGDWAEYSHSLGFPTWKHNEYPCLWCRADQDTLYLMDGLQEDVLPWGDNDASAYDEACRRCEVYVIIATEGLRDLVASQLYYDKRLYGSRGRALKGAIPALQLQAGDRLEPFSGLPDIAGFEMLPLPATVLFWRPSRETFAKHRNPLFSPELGISVQSLRVDTLHTLYLGVFQLHCAAVVHALAAADVWQTARTGCANLPERLQTSALHLTHEVHAWVRSQGRGDLTEIPEIGPRHLGSAARPDCKLKGAQTKTLLLFLHDFLPKHAASLPHGADMMEASGYLVGHMDLLSRAPHAWSIGDREDHRKRTYPTCDRIAVQIVFH